MVVALVFLISLVPLGAFSTVNSEPTSRTLEDKAFICLTEVYPLNLTRYNITLGTVCTLPPGPSENFVTQSINYNLNSPDSNLVANFMFQNGKLYQLSLSILNGTVFTARTYDTLTDAARDFLVKYQAYSSADSTELIRLLENFEMTNNSTVTLGDNSLIISHLMIPTVGNNGTTFQWIYALNRNDDTVVDLSFSNDIFSSFMDTRQLYAVGSKEAIDAAMNYINNGTRYKVINLNQTNVVAEYLASPRNDSMHPFWRVALNADETGRNEKGFQLDVWADSGVVFNCTEAVSFNQSNDSQIDFTLIVTVIIIAVAIALTVAFKQRNYHPTKDIEP